MGNYITSESIRKLRESAGLTQKTLAERVGVTDKAISKWETGRGLPDISLLEPLSCALGISLAELLAGERITNTNRSGNLSRTRFYVCPVCGNVISALGDATISCCGVRLPVLEAEKDCKSHSISCCYSDGDLYIEIDHPMTKQHFISFIAYVTCDQVYLKKLYPEQTAEARFVFRGAGSVYFYCNKDGLFCERVSSVKRTTSSPRFA